MEPVPVAFARVLRSMGVDVAVSSVIAYTEALHAVGVERRRDVYWAGRATLVRRPEDIAAYDAAFAAFFLDAAATAPPMARTTQVLERHDEGEGGGTRFSPAERLRHKDFAACSADELAEARRLMARLRLPAATRVSRRQRAAGRGTPDLRRTVRHALRTRGVPLKRAFEAPTSTPRRVVLLLDVSGSMEPYARALVHFVHAAVAARRHGRVEAFAFGTRVTRLTRDLQSRDPDAAVAAAARRVLDWSGGTRLSACLKDFNDQWGARGATVVILSDGWDRGDPEAVAEQMARLGRVAHKVVWVNPHKASPGFEPLARGMAAALPYVDHFVEGHSVASLEALAEVVG